MSNKQIIDKLGYEFEQLVAIKMDMEESLPQTYIKKMDTILGKMENLMYSIADKDR